MPHILRFLGCLIVALMSLACFTATSAWANPYPEAFKALERGEHRKAQLLVSKGSDRTLNLVLRSMLMMEEDDPTSITEVISFISHHPDWPFQDKLLARVEEKIPEGTDSQQVANWFTSHPPLTPTGFYRAISALDKTGKSKMATTLIRNRWIHHTFTKDEQHAFQTHFSPILKRNDHRARLDRLLWEEKTTSAQELFPLLDHDTVLLAKARIGIIQNKNNISALIAAVPKRLQQDAGLLYERLKWRRKKDLDQGALDILFNPPRQLKRADLWWKERHIMVRRMIEKKSFKTAYRLASKHGLSRHDGFDFIQAEFISGWLALRFLNKPSQALHHFQKQFNASSSAVSRSRGAYWIARSFDALGQPKKAHPFYKTAATITTSFYGQLAALKLNPKAILTTTPEATIPSSVKQAFFTRDAVRAVNRLYSIGQQQLAEKFMTALRQYSTERTEFILLMELAYGLGRPDWAVQVAKTGNRLGFMFTTGGYPLLATTPPPIPEPAFIHALIRQESLFNRQALSPSGARGLMQLMPSTARETARKLNLSYQSNKLSQEIYNVRLGSAFVQKQIDRFDGSYVLSLAGYNAGPSRAHSWIQTFGNPSSSLDKAIDWVEMIPIYETRNYVQRILENLQVYRARLKGGKHPILLAHDLQR